MRRVRIVGWLAVMAVLCVATRALRLRLVELHRSAQHYEDVYYLPRAEYLPLLSLGYRAALADVLWCKSLVYFGEELVHRGVVRYLFQYTDAIIALDPSFREPYRWVPTAALYRPGLVSKSDSLHAAEYLGRALQRWPDDGELHWEYGSLLRFELVPQERDPQRKRALLERAAPHLETAARLGAGPIWLGLNSAELLNKLGRTEQAIRHLEELRALVSEPSVQLEIEQKLWQLRTESYVAAQRTAEQQFEEARLRHYPYLSPELYMFIGDPPARGAYEAFVTGGFLP